MKRSSSNARKVVPRVRIERVVAEVAAERGVAAHEITADVRVRKVKEARWEAWRRLIGPNDSIASVARQWPCDHSTIVNALNRLEERQTA